MEGVDRRVKVNFKTLNEEQENKIISSLIDFLVWYKQNEKIVNKGIEKRGKKVNDISLVDFWIENIGKSEEIEELLKNINVVADCYEYVKKYKNIILTLKNSPEKWVCAKNHYRTHKQALEMKNLITEMKNNPEVKKIIDYLEKYRFDEDHISFDYAERIIKKCRNIKKAF
jgi:hypothetical protein